MFNIEAGESSLPPKKRPFSQFTDEGVGIHGYGGSFLHPIQPGDEKRNFDTNRKLISDRHVIQLVVRREVAKIKSGKVTLSYSMCQKVVFYSNMARM